MRFTANLNLLLQPYKQGSNHGLYTPLLSCLFFVCMIDLFIAALGLRCCPRAALWLPFVGFSLQ